MVRNQNSRNNNYFNNWCTRFGKIKKWRTSSIALVFFVLVLAELLYTYRLLSPKLLVYQNSEILYDAPVQTKTTSTANVLKQAIKFAALDLDLDSFASHELFPPVGIVRHKQFECKHYPLDPDHKHELQSHWKNYVDRAQQGDRGCEFMQEIGFIHFFQSTFLFVETHY